MQGKNCSTVYVISPFEYCSSGLAVGEAGALSSEFSSSTNGDKECPGALCLKQYLATYICPWNCPVSVNECPGLTPPLVIM